MHVAYQVLGDGPLDLVLLPTGTSHVELSWEMPRYAELFRRLATFSRLIRFDHRGQGLSDPLGLSGQTSLEARVEDTLAALDAAGSERAVIVANDGGGFVGILFAASYPNRTASLVLHGCYARLARARDYPFGVPQNVLEEAVSRVEDARREGDAPDESTGLVYTAPRALGDAELMAQFGRYVRHTSRPGTVRAEAEIVTYSDVRPFLSAIQAPTLVLYRRDDQWIRKPHATYLAEHIEGAKLVEVPGENNHMMFGDSDADLDEIEEFLTGVRQAPPTDRVLATVLFTDIVGSTERAAELGDKKWRELLDRHDRAVRRQLDRFRGKEVNTVGDGFLATFDGPGRAIECASAIRDALRAMGIEVRAGLHTGEIEIRGEDVAGMAVHIGARVSALAKAGEVLVSGAVPPLVAGSNLEFLYRGEHELKGVPGFWKVFAVGTATTR
jgi:class 3 adenylate cyclase/alpha-beta hydrolase superfamily lysophospholipase